LGSTIGQEVAGSGGEPFEEPLKLQEITLDPCRLLRHGPQLTPQVLLVEGRRTVENQLANDRGEEGEKNTDQEDFAMSPHTAEQALPQSFRPRQQRLGTSKPTHILSHLGHS
jgi:hypothetical protein